MPHCTEIWYTVAGNKWKARKMRGESGDAAFTFRKRTGVTNFTGV